MKDALTLSKVRQRNPAENKKPLSSLTGGQTQTKKLSRGDIPLRPLGYSS
nr:MAG TPA: hypothetical protein [Caudoviricetes sp.]